jgi:single-strand DNA-binding protein
MKNITIAGRLTRDAENRTAGSDNVTGFSVAVDDRQGKEKSTLFFDCNLWGKRGESLSQYLTKGSSVTVSGDLSTREHNGKTYLTVRVADVTLQGGKPQSGEDFRGTGSGSVAGDDRHGRGQDAGRRAAYDMSDDVPFIRHAFSGEA